MSPIERAWENLSNTMRVYVENRLRFEALRRVDPEEAINNVDRAFESKLETFHTLYDVTKDLPGFDYFGHGDTSLIIVLRNAAHHRDHSLFVSWNARLGLGSRARDLAGAEFLLASTTPETEYQTARFYFRLQDFYDRLQHPMVKNAAKLRSMWDTQLCFGAMATAAAAKRYPTDQVYVDVMPAFMAAVRRASGWLYATGFQPHGFDGQTYFRHFRTLQLQEQLGYKTLRLPQPTAVRGAPY